MTTQVMRSWRFGAVAVLIVVTLAGCGGGGGGGGTSSGDPSGSSSTPIATSTPATGFVDARSVDSATGSEIAAPITLNQPSGQKSGTGRVFSENLPVGSSVTVTFGDFSGGGYATPQESQVVVTITAGATIVTGRYDALPPPP